MMKGFFGFPDTIEAIVNCDCFRDESKEITILFHGDILNQDNTESILDLYSKHGINFVEKIDGSYSIAIQDKNKKLLIRDRCGTRPLFYLNTGHDLLFATDIKSILSHPGYTKSVNLRALNNFLSYGYIPHPDTMFNDIKQVRPGHVLIYEGGKVEEKEYWKFKYKPVDHIRTEEDYIGTFLEILEKSVSRCLKKHPDAGAFLSGGLDTSGVVALMHKLKGNDFKVFTAGFHEKAFNEIEDAKILSRYLDLDHYTTLIDFTDDFPQFLKDLIWHHDEPFADTSAIPSFHVAKLAKAHVNAVLTGDFPDQLIGGSGHQVHAMNKEKNEPGYKRLLRNKRLNAIARSVGVAAGTTSVFDKIKRAFYRETFPIEEQRIIMNMPVPPHLKPCLYTRDMMDINRRHDPMDIARGLYKDVQDEPLLNKILYFDTLSYAPDDLKTKVDRMCSANNLNAISPFHDLELIEFCESIPVNMKIREGNRKYIMREALRPLLPDHTLNKKKQGFAMPIGEWLVKNMSGFVRDLLLDSKTLNRGYFNKKFMNLMILNYLEGKTDYACGADATIISLITLEIWHRLFVDE